MSTTTAVSSPRSSKPRTPTAASTVNSYKPRTPTAELTPRFNKPRTPTGTRTHLGGATLASDSPRRTPSSLLRDKRKSTPLSSATRNRAFRVVTTPTSPRTPPIGDSAPHIGPHTAANRPSVAVTSSKRNSSLKTSTKRNPSLKTSTYAFGKRRSLLDSKTSNANLRKNSSKKLTSGKLTSARKETGRSTEVPICTDDTENRNGAINKHVVGNDCSSGKQKNIIPGNEKQCAATTVTTCLSKQRGAVDAVKSDVEIDNDNKKVVGEYADEGKNKNTITGEIDKSRYLDFNSNLSVANSISASASVMDQKSDANYTKLNLNDHKLNGEDIKPDCQDPKPSSTKLSPDSLHGHDSTLSRSQKSSFGKLRNKIDTALNTRLHQISAEQFVNELRTPSNKVILLIYF